MSEPRYTLAEAQHELAKKQCAATGHSWDFIMVNFDEPVRIICRVCGWSGDVTMRGRP